MTTFIKSKSVKAVAGFLTITALVLGGFVLKASTVSAAECTAYTFGSGLYKQGANNMYVKEIQQFLNKNGFTISTSGAGSMGAETNYYGSKTKAAVMAFQVAKGVINTGNFGPLSRTAALAHQANNCSGTGSVPQTGPVTAMLSMDNPAAGTLVGGQATADLAHFTFSGAGVVTNVTLQRIGISADTTLSNVYLFDGVNRLTDAASVSSNGMITFSMPSGIFSVTGSKTISVKADIASVSGQTVGVKMTSFTVSGGTAQTVNISGNLHNTASATLAAVSAGTVTPSSATLNPGANVTLWQSTLTVSNRDVWMKRVAFRNLGSAQASAFANFKLYVNGVQVASAGTLDANGYVTFDMMNAPVLVATGARIMRVDADIISGASRTVQLSLRNAADVDFVDSSFGVNITATSTPWTASAANTISGSSGGSLTIEKDVSSASGSVAEGVNDYVLGVFKLTAYGEPMKVENIRATYTSSDAAIGSLRNGRIMIGGMQYGSTATLNEDSQGTPYTQYTLNFTVYPGTPVMMELRADLYDNDGTDSIDAADTVIGTIAAGSSNVQKVDSLGSVSAPNATTVAANTLTFASTAAVLTKNSSYANQNTSLPATNFKIGSWNLTGSSIEDILLTTLSIDVDEVVSTEFDEGDLTNMYVVIKNGSTIVSQPSPLATVAAADNNFSINYTLLKNTNVSIELYANMSDDGSDSAIDAADSFKTDLTVTGTALTSGTGVTATSADTDGQTIAYAAASVTATADTATPVAAIVYDNQAVTTASFKFATITAGFNVTDLTFTLGSATVATAVQLWDGSTLVASNPAAATVTFNGLNWNVPANTNKILTVKLVLGSVMDSSADGTGSTSGAALLTTLTSFTAINTSTGVSAAGTESNPAGNVTYAYAAIPMIANNDLPSSNIVAGTNSFAKYTVTANGGTVGWKKTIFSISRASTGAAVANTFTLWDQNGVQVAGTATLTDSSGDNDCGDIADTSCTVTFVATTEQGVSSSNTYTLKGSVSGTLTDGDYFATSVAQPSAFVASDNYTAVAATAATFVWSDLTGNGHDAGSVTVTDWNNAYLVKVLPNDAQTLTRAL